MPLREILLIIICVGLVGVAIARPFWGLLGWFWFSLMRPDALAWAEGKYPIALVLGILVLILSAPTAISRTRRIFRNPIVVVFLLFLVPVCLSALFCQGPYLAPDRLSGFLRLSVMVMLVPLMVENLRDMRVLLAVCGASLGLVGMKFGLWSVLKGGQVFMSGHSYQYDNNTLGLAFAMAMPICWYSASQFKNKIASSSFYFMSLFSGVAAVMTTSRGAALSFACVVGLMVLASKRKFALALILVLALGPGLLLVQEKIRDRFTSQEAQDSSASRWKYWGLAVDVIKDYPLFGVGFGSRNYIRLASSYAGEPIRHNVHNTYLQVLVDTGIGGFGLYVVMLFGSITWLGLSAREFRHQPQTAAIPRMIQLSLVAFAVDATFHSMVRMEYAVTLILSAAAWFQIQSMIKSGELTEPNLMTPVPGAASALRPQAGGFGQPQPALETALPVSRTVVAPQGIRSRRMRELESAKSSPNGGHPRAPISPKPTVS